MIAFPDGTHRPLHDPSSGEPRTDPHPFRAHGPVGAGLVLGRSVLASLRAARPGERGFLLGTPGRGGRPDLALFVTGTGGPEGAAHARGVARAAGLSVLGTFGHTVPSSAPGVAPSRGQGRYHLLLFGGAEAGRGPDEVPGHWRLRALRRAPDGTLRETPLALLGPRLDDPDVGRPR